MSKDIGVIKKSGSRGVELFLTRYWGGDKNGYCLQLSALQEDGVHGYIQLSTSDIMALLPILKSHLINPEMERQKRDTEDTINECKELEKTIVSDMRTIAEMAAFEPIAKFVNLLFYDGKLVENIDGGQHEE